MTPTRLKAVQTCLSLKGFPLNFPRTEVTIESRKGQKRVSQFTFDRVEIPWGKPSSPPEELAFLLGFFRLVLEPLQGVVCYNFSLEGECQGWTRRVSLRCRRVVMVLRGWVAKYSHPFQSIRITSRTPTNADDQIWTSFSKAVDCCYQCQQSISVHGARKFRCTTEKASVQPQGGQARPTLIFLQMHVSVCVCKLTNFQREMYVDDRNSTLETPAE